jgi:hypothetical protein
MKLGLKCIISVTSTTNIPHAGVKVSMDIYKSVKSAIGSCNLPKKFSHSDFVKMAAKAGNVGAFVNPLVASPQLILPVKAIGDIELPIP